MKTALVGGLILIGTVVSLFYFSFHSTPKYYVIQLPNGLYTYEIRRPLNTYRSAFTKSTYKEALKFVEDVSMDDRKPVKEWEVKP